MIGNFQSCDAFTSQQEGGFSNDRDDPGNWTGGVVGVGILKGTKYGIAASTHAGIDIANLTEYQASLLRAPSWAQVDGDGLPLGVDLMVYDFAINAGARRSALVLEAVLGSVQDGKVGSTDTTLAGMAVAADLIDKLQLAQGAFYRSLSTFSTFGRGWLARTTARRAAARAMLAAAPAPAAPTPPPAVSALTQAEHFLSGL